MKRRPGNVFGIHLEGPFLNPEKRGAHREALLRKPDDALLDKIIAEGRDVIRVITIAPEFFNKAKLDNLLNSGINVSIPQYMVPCEETLRSEERRVGKEWFSNGSSRWWPSH